VSTPWELVGARPEPALTFTFDGEPVTALPGQTIAAALLAAGVRTLRTTRFQRRPRGLFCGIGACFDCLVTVNGRSSQRACLVEAAPGDVVATQEGADRADRG
jgi:predicted molibdopterin-dependent oxidoreductase YjgC